MNVNELSRMAALTGGTLPSNMNSPWHILVLEGDAIKFSPVIEVLTKLGCQVNDTEEKIVGWQGRLASNHHRKIQSAKH